MKLCLEDAHQPETVFKPQWKPFSLRPKMQKLPAIIFSDLDGTLLDHHSYSFQPAQQALKQVKAEGIPLLLTTSKTLAETVEINQALDNQQPIIAENGGVLCFPEGYFDDPAIDKLDVMHGYHVMPLSTTYQEIIRIIAKVRSRHQLRVRGFNDMSVAEVMQETGLSHAQAANAKQRLAGEPFQWLDCQTTFETFKSEVYARDLRITRGGRFWHLMGQYSKGAAMGQMLQQFRRNGIETESVITLGDSDNDIEMLETSDIAVVIKRHDDSHIDCLGKQQTLFTEESGPTGWNSAILNILRAMECKRFSEE